MENSFEVFINMCLHPLAWILFSGVFFRFLIRKTKLIITRNSREYSHHVV